MPRISMSKYYLSHYGKDYTILASDAPDNPAPTENKPPASPRTLREEAKRIVEFTDHAELLRELIERCKLKNTYAPDPALLQGIIRVSQDLIDLRVRRLAESGAINGR